MLPSIFGIVRYVWRMARGTYTHKYTHAYMANDHDELTRILCVDASYTCA